LFEFDLPNISTKFLWRLKNRGFEQTFLLANRIEKCVALSLLKMFCGDFVVGRKFSVNLIEIINLKSILPTSTVQMPVC